jgi:hypothetical protein
MTARLWFALLGGHTAWSVHLLVSYYLAARACAAGGGDTPELAALRHAVTAAGAAVALASAAAAWPDWRRARRHREPAIPSPPVAGGEGRFLARVTFPPNLTFLLALLAAGATNFFLVPCA